MAGALAAVPLDAASAGPPASADDAVTWHDNAETVQIGTFNWAGGHDTYNGQRAEAVAALHLSIREREPAFVLLQEACEDWAASLDLSLPPGYTVTFDEVREADLDVAQCRDVDGGGDDDTPRSPFGLAVVHRTDLGFRPALVDLDGDAAGYDLGTPQTPPSERREMLCVVAHELTTVACSAHLSVDDSEVDRSGHRQRELVAARGILDSRFPGYVHVLGGDFNAPPDADELDQVFHRDLYGGGATGPYLEVDSVVPGTRSPCRSCGEATHDDWPLGEEGSPVGSKIDYLFVSPVVPVADADATTAAYSDHDPLWATLGSG